MSTRPLIRFEETGDCFELQQNDCKCNSWKSWNPIQRGFLIRTKTPRNCNRIGWLGLFFFLFALVSSFYLVWKWHEFNEYNRIRHGRQNYVSELKLVSLFNRHGDRAPSDELPDVDKHKQAIEFFWPNGLHNLTDLGKVRSYKLGLALRHMYDGYVGYDHRQVLAFSSKKLRCIESLQNTLKGFYELEGPKSRGLLAIGQWQGDNCTACLPGGSGSPEAWKLIRLDTESISTLTERDIEQCRYRREHPSPLDRDLKLHPRVRALPGIDRLEQVMEQRYGLQGLYGGTMTAIYSTITSELNLARTRHSIQYTDHYSDWLGQVVASTEEGGFNITLYDIFEQATVYKYRDQTLGVAKWLEIGPMITSLIDAQLVALGRHQEFKPDARNNTSSPPEAAQGELYQDKRVIFYSTHDSILQRIVQHLDLISFDEQLTYERRFSNWKSQGADEFDKFLKGLSMSFYGFSIKFELWQAKTPAAGGTGEQGKVFPYVQVSLYNQEESRFGEIQYKPLQLGEACVRLFKKKYANEVNFATELNRFYDPELQIDWRFACPFELFRNITSDLMVEKEKFAEFC